MFLDICQTKSGPNIDREVTKACNQVLKVDQEMTRRGQTRRQLTKLVSQATRGVDSWFTEFCNLDDGWKRIILLQNRSLSTRTKHFPFSWCGTYWRWLKDFPVYHRTDFCHPRNISFPCCPNGGEDMSRLVRKLLTSCLLLHSSKILLLPLVNPSI